MLENGWVLNVDRDYAAYCGEESWVDKKEPGDSEFGDFVYTKSLATELAKQITGETDTEAAFMDLIDMLRNTDQYKRQIDKDEYQLVSEQYAKEFDEFMEG